MDASIFPLARRLTGSLVDALSDEETSANYIPVDMDTSAISTVCTFYHSSALFVFTVVAIRSCRL